MKMKMVFCLALCAVTSGVFAGAPVRELSFEERITAQRVIERVYYAHQLEARVPFEEAVPRVVLEKKVHKYLKQSIALERFWSTPITADTLQHEMERIARNTRFPERLAEIYAGLGNDPFLIRECFARPILVDRLARSFFATDESIHGVNSSGILGVGDAPRVEGTKRGWDEWWVSVEDSLDEGRVQAVISSDPLPSAAPLFQLSIMGSGAPSLEAFAANSWNNGSLDDFPEIRRGHTAVWTGSVMIVWGGGNESNTNGVAARRGSRYDPLTDTWSGMTLNGAPPPGATHVAVWTGQRMVVWGGGSTGGRYDPVADTWTPVTTVGAPSAGRTYASSAWTGTFMVIWGGSDPLNTNTGARYNPVTDTWLPMSIVNAPPADSDAPAVWTGSVVVIWTSQAQGGRYDPASDTWTPMTTVNAPSARFSYSAVWTGTEAIIWGGNGTSTGGRYNPATDQWVPTSTINVPLPRANHTAVWTGTTMVVWGGVSGNPSVNTGGRYDPATDTWLATSLVNAPSVRTDHTAIWTGSRMVVWGGITFTSSGYLNTGGRYDPATDTWTPTSMSPAPEARWEHATVWTGSLMIVWGGRVQPISGGPSSSVGTGGRYDPLADSWTPTSMTGAPTPRSSPATVWTGREMVIWGGESGSGLGTGGRYDPAADSWRSTSTLNPAVSLSAAVWTGSQMLIWGGKAGVTGPYPSQGAKYDPEADLWTTMTTLNAPTGRSFPAGVWTGQEMVVWGGYQQVAGSPSIFFNSGGRYNPDTDTWTATTLAGAPTSRYGHTGVWNGNEMIIWGGKTGDLQGTNVNSGARYNPLTDLWTPTSLSGPSVRAFHSAVWTGSRMIIWGGLPNGFTDVYKNDGGIYDSSTNLWAPLSLVDAPVGRSSHSGVWTGCEMVIWGGNRSFPLNIGGRYFPPGTVDADADGFPACAGDCDDTNPNVHPGVAEICNGVDDDCDAAIDEDGSTICSDGDSCSDDFCAGALGCSHSPRPDGASCTDGNACTQDDICQSGVCAGAPVTCSAPDDCHAPGACVPATGTCSEPTPLPDGSSCDDGDPCTQGDMCQSATCVGSGSEVVVSVQLSPSALRPANHKMVDIQATVTAHDECGQPLPVVLSSVTSSEPDDIPGSTDGHTVNDIQGTATGTADFSFQLRAENDRTGPGRIYTVTYTATNSSGGQISASAIVSVPAKGGGGGHSTGGRLKPRPRD